MPITPDIARQLTFVYDGWEGYNRSLVSAVRILTPEQLAFRPTPQMRSVSELFWHIAGGRPDWFQRIDESAFAPIARAIKERQAALAETPLTAEELSDWLNRTWEAVAATLAQWTVDDLTVTYHQSYGGKVYAVSRQWVIWRIMAHDIHHGGQISEALALQGIFPSELTLLGGHLTEPPLA